MSEKKKNRLVRTYSYGAKPPIEGADRINEQLSLAHKYYNALIEIEKRRQKRRAEILLRKETDPRKLVWTICRREKATGGDPELRAIDEEANAERRAQRATCELYWGTYMTVENAVDIASERQAKRDRKEQDGQLPDLEKWQIGPKFKRWDWHGQVATQIQKNITVEELLSGEDRRVRLVGEGKHRQVWMRIGSEGRNPIWGVFPIVYHRDLPPSAKIKWVRACRKKIGTKLRWDVQFILDLDKADIALPPATKGTVAIDVGWRKMEDGIRVAFWADDGGDSGQLLIPSRLIQRLQKVDDLKSIRDQKFNEVRDRLVALRREGADWPEWLQEATRYTYAWRQIGKLAALVWNWRDRRFPGDEALYDELEAWRKHDKHLLEWEANQRSNVLLARRELYRHFALEMAQYEQVVIERLDLRDFAEHPKPGEPKEGHAVKKARGNRHKAALSELLGCVTDAVLRSTGTCVEQDPEFTTQSCWACEELEPFDAAASIVHTCQQCGATWDQDYNAAKNLLRMAQCGQITKKRSRRIKPSKNRETRAERKRKAGLETRRRHAVERGTRKVSANQVEVLV